MRVYTEQSGFTIIELLIAMGVVVIITTLAANFAVRGLQIQRIVGEQNQAVADSRRALDRFVNEVRETAPSDTGAYAIEQADPQELVFYSDVDHDEMIERIHYYLEGSLLQRGVIEPSGDPLTYDPADEQIQTVSAYIRNGTDPLFYYYNEDYPGDIITNPLADPVDISAIRLIEFQVDTNIDPDRVPKTHTLEELVNVRNLKENF